MFLVIFGYWYSAHSLSRRKKLNPKSFLIELLFLLATLGIFMRIKILIYEKA